MSRCTTSHFKVPMAFRPPCHSCHCRCLFVLSCLQVLEMTEEEQTFRVRGVREDCVPSILRGFSAPVRLINRPQTAKESAFLLAYDTDPVTKWFASRALATPIVISRSKRISAKGNAQKLEQLPDDYVEGLRTILTDQATDNALKVNPYPRSPLISILIKEPVDVQFLLIHESCSLRQTTLGPQAGGE